MGGALAVLCAFDLATRCPCAGALTNIKCYTFGAPRVGNHVWARMFNERVPDTWQLVNADGEPRRCLMSSIPGSALAHDRVANSTASTDGAPKVSTKGQLSWPTELPLHLQTP